MAKKSKSLSDLPEALKQEIFLRLSVKSLQICKSVCKPWLYTLSDPEFVKSQLHRANFASRNNPTLLNIIDENQMEALETQRVGLFGEDFAVREERQIRRRQLLNQARDDANAQDFSTSPVKFTRAALVGRITLARFISCCNGIICLANHDVAYLWNPSIKMFKQLEFPNPHDNIPITIGFGYDHISDEYKLLRFVYENKDDVFPIAKVYYLNADYRCREFQGPILNSQINVSPSNVVVNGVLYFDAGDQLVSFDLHEEVFGLVPFPNSMPRKRSDILDFEGSVAMVFESGSEVDLWTLDRISSGQLSWTKKFSIQYGLQDLDTEIWLSCYLGAKQFYGRKKLLNGNYFVYEILYDYEKKDTKYYAIREHYVNLYASTGDEFDIPLCAIQEDSPVPAHAAVKYTETLVSLYGFQLEPKDERFYWTAYMTRSLRRTGHVRY